MFYKDEIYSTKNIGTHDIQSVMKFDYTKGPISFGLEIGWLTFFVCLWIVDLLLLNLMKMNRSVESGFYTKNFL